MNEQKDFSVNAKSFFASSLGKITVMVISGMIIYGLIVVGLTASTPIFLITMLGCGYFGWKALNVIRPNIFLIMPIGGWCIYFLIKGFLSVGIGAFIAPFQIGKMIASFTSDMAKGN